jgi:hypothetical protein
MDLQDPASCTLPLLERERQAMVEVLLEGL